MSNTALLAALIGQARTTTGLRAAAFDYSLATAGWNGQAGMALSAALYLHANRRAPEVQPGCDPKILLGREQRDRDLRQQLAPEIQALMTRVRSTRYTSWSDAARSRGHRIDYAR